MPISNSKPAVEPSPQEISSNPLKASWDAFANWWRKGVRQEIKQRAVVDKVREESGWSLRYAFMLLMSAGIAILGLLLSSPAVVIGAMLLSPLLGPMMGAGFALAIGDLNWGKQSAYALAVGTIISILFCAFIVMMSPLQNVTPEIASRTRPNLFDLGVALFSALAGAYSMIRGREGTIVGVAIATALMPPLAVVGFGLATLNWTVFGGALLLYFTNLMTIALTAAVMARLYGFRSRLSDKQTKVQAAITVIIFIALAVPLGYSLRQIAWESNATRIATSVVKDEFGSGARLSQIDLDFSAHPLAVNATVLTPEFQPDAERRSERLMEVQLGQDIDVNISQFRVGTNAGDAEAAEIAAAKANEQIAAQEQEITELAQRLSLVAGVPPQDVIIDRQAKRAVVKAKKLPGATLETYYALERRAEALEEGWSVIIEPPASKLPVIEMENGEPSAEGARNIVLAAWAAQRIDAPLGIQGSARNAQQVLELLKAQDIACALRPGGNGRSDQVVLSWLPPDTALGEDGAP